MEQIRTIFMKGWRVWHVCRACASTWTTQRAHPAASSRRNLPATPAGERGSLTSFPKSSWLKGTARELWMTGLHLNGNSSAKTKRQLTYEYQRISIQTFRSSNSPKLLQENCSRTRKPTRMFHNFVWSTFGRPLCRNAAVSFSFQEKTIWPGRMTRRGPGTASSAGARDLPLWPCVATTLSGDLGIPMLSGTWAVKARDSTAWYTKRNWFTNAQTRKCSAPCEVFCWTLQSETRPNSSDQDTRKYKTAQQRRHTLVVPGMSNGMAKV